jgi:endo-1,4-beta-xylanase
MGLYLKVANVLTPYKVKLIIIATVSAILLVSLIVLINRPRQTVLLPSPPLKELAARHHIELGNFAILNHIHDSRYSQILTSQFNLALADNTPNWYFTDGGLRPSPTSYNFKQMDQVVHYALANHMAIQAHHLLWGEDKWLPDWLKKGNYNQAQLMDIIHDHITTVAGRYKGKVSEWTVVNEAFTRSQHVSGLHDWWADHTGDDAYIDQAFVWARQADPNAKLILNDFGNETSNPISDAMYVYIKSAKERGIPIDGIGMQMHIDGTRPPDTKAVVSTMRRFGALGIKVYVTEFDVNMSAVPVPDTTKDRLEGAIYYNMARACIESKVCPSFSELGITDQETWYNYMGPTTADARPLMFDAKYRPKPAYYSFRTALQQP